MRTYLFDLSRELDSKMQNSFKQLSENLSRQPKSLEAYVDFVKQVNEAAEREQQLHAELKDYNDMKVMLSKHRQKEEANIGGSKVSKMQSNIDGFSEQLDKLKLKITTAKEAKDANHGQNVEQLH